MKTMGLRNPKMMQEKFHDSLSGARFLDSVIMPLCTHMKFSGLEDSWN
jgi:hypothetical protein